MILLQTLSSQPFLRKHPSLCRFPDPFGKYFPIPILLGYPYTSQANAHLMSGLKAVSCQELNVFCWILAAGYYQWRRIWLLLLPFFRFRYHLFLQVYSVHFGYSFCYQISSASTYRIKTKMKVLAGNSESINAARWSGGPIPTASLLEAPTLFQRVTKVTCRVLCDTLLAVNCLWATLGCTAWFHNSVNWW